MKNVLRKIGLLGIVLCCVSLLFAACAQSRDAGTANGPYTAFETLEDSQIGVSIEMPKDESGTLVKAFIEPTEFPAETQPKDGIQIVYFAPSFWAGGSSLSADELQKQLFFVQYYDQAAWDGWIAEGKSMSDITGKKTNQEIGRKDGMVYIYSGQDVDEGKLEGQDLELYRAAVKLIPKIRDGVKLIPRAASNMGAFPAISTKDINGNDVDKSVLSGNKLTMINFWATFCGPCIEEMPDLEQMSKEMPEGTQLIGVAGDALDDKLISQSQQIAKDKGVTYLNLLPDATLAEYVAKNIVAYPTTIFLDSKGNIIGDAIVGAHNREFYEAELASRLKSLDAAAGSTEATGATGNVSQKNSPAGSQNGGKVPGPAPAA